MSILIKAEGDVFPEEFRFEPDCEDPAWYDLDGAVSQNEGATLRLNADREVYGIYTGPDGTEKYGTIGDSEGETIPDNYPVDLTEYWFYEHPETKEYYYGTVVPGETVRHMVPSD